MKKFVNLTPHAVTINGETIPSSGVARCEEITLGTTQVGGIKVDSRIYGKTVGLPDQQEDICLIVSHIVAQNNPNRSDLFWPGALKRDDHGNVIGVESLNQLPRHNRSILNGLYDQCENQMDRDMVSNWKGLDFVSKFSEPMPDGTWFSGKPVEGGVEVAITDKEMKWTKTFTIPV